MRLLSLIFGDKQTARPPGKNGADCIEFCTEDCWADMPFGMVWIKTESDSILCQYSQSPDRRYLVAWNEGNGGRGDGKLVIAYQNRIVYTGNIKRPLEAAIANNGVCILYDCPFTDSSHTKMNPQVSIIDFTGHVLLGENPGGATVGISPNGHYAAYMDSSSILCFVDVYQGLIVWRYLLPDTCPQFIVFDDSSKTITVKFMGNKSLVPRHGGPVPDYKITYSGEALTRDAKKRAGRLTQEEYNEMSRLCTVQQPPNQKQIEEYKPILYQLVKDNPGILQSDLKKLFPSDLENVVGYANWSNCQEGKIRREKKGRSFQLWIMEGI
jgi:hypothetical protein